MSAVLLVEDELLVRELAAEDFRDMGFAVTAASDGEEAMTYVEGGRRFDLLFTDIRMPGSVDGWQLARAAMTALPGLKVIYATGLGELGHALSECERYVQKPYHIGDLRTVLGELGFG